MALKPSSFKLIVTFQVDPACAKEHCSQVTRALTPGSTRLRIYDLDGCCYEVVSVFSTEELATQARCRVMSLRHKLRQIQCDEFICMKVNGTHHTNIPRDEMVDR